MLFSCSAVSVFERYQILSIKTYIALCFTFVEYILRNEICTIFIVTTLCKQTNITRRYTQVVENDLLFFLLATRIIAFNFNCCSNLFNETKHPSAPRSVSEEDKTRFRVSKTCRIKCYAKIINENEILRNHYEIVFNLETMLNGENKKSDKIMLLLQRLPNI